MVLRVLMALPAYQAHQAFPEWPAWPGPPVYRARQDRLALKDRPVHPAPPLSGRPVFHRKAISPWVTSATDLRLRAH